jgi:hypothetical protein
MSTAVIIYKNSNNGVSIVVPVPNSSLTINDIANRDLPAGTPYRFGTIADIPTELMFSSAWEVDMTTPDGVALGYEAFEASRGTA